jgi:hypothetical protein
VDRKEGIVLSEDFVMTQGMKGNDIKVCMGYQCSAIDKAER